MNFRRPHKRNFSKESAPAETVTLRMERMAQGGDALTHLQDGRVCFVSGALTGELAEVVLSQNKKDFAKGFAKKILEPSEFRTEPQCPFYGKCGGCSMEHATFEFQLEAYRDRRTVPPFCQNGTPCKLENPFWKALRLPQPGTPCPHRQRLGIP